MSFLMTAAPSRLPAKDRVQPRRNPCDHATPAPAAMPALGGATGARHWATVPYGSEPCVPWYRHPAGEGTEARSVRRCEPHEVKYLQDGLVQITPLTE